MKKLIAGILAHVDSGKTTLSEAMLFRGGALRKLGRVDHRDSFLDTEPLERERGITIFSKQAVLSLGDLELTLLDTPGHVDFSAETERTLSVLDYAILVISGSDGVQGHTETLWRLLARYQVPTFLFVNKMDQPGTDRAALLAQLKARLSEGCVDFSAGQSWADFSEQLALCDEGLMEHYLEGRPITEEQVSWPIARRRVFPVYFGSALKLDGVEAFLDGLARYTVTPRYPAEFGARVYKIFRDEQGNRLTALKVTGGSLRVKALVSGGSGEGAWQEKADQLRIYSGAKFRTVEEAPAGTVCAVLGLTHTRPGEGLGAEVSAEAPALEPVLSYRVILPEGCDAPTMLAKLRLLEEEDPQLHLVWNETLGEIHVQLMGEIQLEILRSLIAQRFGVEVEFGQGGILYRETILAPVEGVGHFEPLRHYAEVHLLMEPGRPGSGLRFEAQCSTDRLDLNWQRLILTHLAEKDHLGVLVGAPITDMKITLVAGRAHLKHTEGGDFRQATYRAVRQGLRKAKSQLLEPWYRFRLEVPEENTGRAMADLQRRGAEFSPPEQEGGIAVLCGSGPVSTLRDYPREVTAYSHGRGRITLSLAGYAPCHNAAEVIAEAAYRPDADPENPADSVFCAHGAGFSVPWNEVESYMHLNGLELDAPTPEPEAPRPIKKAARPAGGSLAEDKLLMEIFEKEFGPIKRRDFRSAGAVKAQELNHPAPPKVEGMVLESVPEYLLVDGYNIIFSWEELQTLARVNLDSARQALIDLLCNYRGFRSCEVILVFDAYRVHGNPGSVTKHHNIHIVYTREAETADSYIEKVTYQLGKNYRVRVATSDGAEQMIILGHNCLRLPARAFKQEVEAVNGEIKAILEKNNRL